MTTTNDLDTRIAARMAELQQQRAAIPDDDDLPGSMTRKELNAVATQRRDLDRKISALRSAAEAVAELGSTSDDEAWAAQLEEWRRDLTIQFMELRKQGPARDPKTIGLERSLLLSLKTVEQGNGQFEGTGWSLESSRLGLLMIASGYQLEGADPRRNFAGTLPWHGGAREVAKRIKRLAQQRKDATKALERALESDTDREARDAREAELRNAFNSMDIRHAPVEGSSLYTLIAYDANDRPIPVDAMTPLQHEAFEAAVAREHAWQIERRQAHRPEEDQETTQV